MYVAGEVGKQTPTVRFGPFLENLSRLHSTRTVWDAQQSGDAIIPLLPAPHLHGLSWHKTNMTRCIRYIQMAPS